MTYCIECRKELPNNSRFCLRCGASQSVKTTDGHNVEADSNGDYINLGPCPECASPRVIAYLHRPGYNLSLAPLNAKISAWTGLPVPSSLLRNQALVCPNCGNVAFFVEKPEIFDPESPEDTKK